MVPSAAFNSTELSPHPVRVLEDRIAAGYSEHVPQNYSLLQNSTVILDEIELSSIALSITYFEPPLECENQLGFIWKFVDYSADAGFKL